MAIMQTFSRYILMTLSLTMLPASARAEPAVEATIRLSEPFRAGISLLWSPTGQDSWDHLKAYHSVKSLELEPRSEAAEELNEFVWDRQTTLPPGSLSMAGKFTKAFATEIRGALSKMIGKQGSDFIEDPPPLGDIPGTPFTREKAAIIVSALVARPRFAGTFQPDSKPRLFTADAGQSRPVLGFGAEAGVAEKMGEGIRVLQDDLHGSMVAEVVLVTASSEDSQRMIVAMHPQITSMKTGIEVIRKAKANAIAPSREIESQGKR